MTDDRSLERAARSWLEEGPTRAPDRAVESAITRIQTTPQERGLRVPWRMPPMNPLTRIVALAAGGVVAIALAMLALRPAATVGPPASSTPAAPTIQGTWDVTFTPQDMLDAGVIGHIAADPRDSGHFRLTFTPDQWQVSHLSPPIWVTAASTYTAEPGIVHIGSPGDTSYNTPYTVNATTLSFGPEAPTWLAVKPWTRLPTEPLASSIPRPPEIPTIGSGAVGTALEPGTYRVDGFAVPFSVTLPTGWALNVLTPTNVSLAPVDNGNVNIGLIVLNKVYWDPCHPDAGPDAFGSSVDELVGALSAITDFEVANLNDATVGGASGKAFDFNNSIDVAASGCSSNPLPFATRQEDGKDVDIEIFSGESDRFWALDASGTTVLIAITNTPQIVAGTQSVFDSLTFGDGSSE